MKWWAAIFCVTSQSPNKICINRAASFLLFIFTLIAFLLIFLLKIVILKKKKMFAMN